MSGAAIAAAAAARKKKEQEYHEEETLTNYNANDIEGWEFKIVRSNTGGFKNYEFVQQVITEEAQNGWEMLEKFDNNRIRFKRSTSRRSMDPHAKIDPYRTTVGIGEGTLALTIVGVILLGIGVVLGVVFLAGGFTG